MITKLRNKVQTEVKQRIENQRALHTHIQNVGSDVSEHLFAKFEKQMK